ncbi:proton-coupled folate transporter-like isoform X2 [Centruroides sculpturatus]|uniref:proton-coupled folate transporter-like isoform X2 n=1 Tax=Centruroides sculpturatus TaxID=218467 RepID=UPI000C6E9F33|nr:proton-coupled folate transporter-like isoform X2 [Centruroides sculpturatus]
MKMGLEGDTAKSELRSINLSNEDRKKTEDMENRTCLQILKGLTIESFMILFMFAYLLGNVSTKNIYIDKVCLNVYNFSANICDHLDNYTDEKDRVEITADNYNLYSSLITTIPAIFFTLVIAPWSDKYGRKLPIFLSLIGIGLENVGLILNTIYFSIPLYWMLVSAIPAGIFGGLTVTITCLYSLISEQTTRKQRTIKYALLEISFGMGAPLGTSVGGVIYKNYGYLYVYVTSLSLQFLAAVWLIFVINDNRNIRKIFNFKAVSDLFCFTNIKESCEAVAKRRPNGISKEILLLIASMCILISIYSAMDGFEFYFAKHMYNWDVTAFSNVKSLLIISGMVIIIIAIPIIIKVLKVTDSCLGEIGSISMFLSNIMKGFAYKAWLYYLAGFTGALSGMSLFAVRSRISKIVSGDELDF